MERKTELAAQEPALQPPSATSTSPAMKFDLIGRVRNTKVTQQHAFLPLFEAVVNSIHSTQDRFGHDVSRRGRIEVVVSRVKQATLPMMGTRATEPIESITIIDNGDGFTDGNLEAFETADTTAKASRGGKGAGRFTWLVVFERVQIASTYSVGSSKRKRSFVFCPTRSGIEQLTDAPANTAVDLETRVTLRGVQARFAEATRKGIEGIADRLFEHCFNYFVLGSCPIMLVREEASGEELRLNDKLSDVHIGDEVPLDVGGHNIVVRHVQRKIAIDGHHVAHLCADERVVTSFFLPQVSELGAGPIRTADGDALYHHVFVRGQALDDAVDTTRTRLELPDGAPLLEVGGALDLKMLRQAIGRHVDEYLAEFLRAIREENFERIQNHIRTVQPEYSQLLAHRRLELERLRWSDNPQQLDEALYKVKQGWELDIRRRQSDVETKLVNEKTEVEKIADELYRVISDTNEAGQADLVRYVVKRRAVLQLIERMTSRAAGPALEEHIHNIVFPIRKTGDDVALDDHNLWLVDDTLAFYEFLASDIPFKSNVAAPVNSKRRPDILAMKSGDPYQHVAIVEFKRPDRDDEDPVRQLVQYGQLLRKGGSIDAQGRTLPGIPQSVRIDGYAIVTLTPAMEEKLQLSPGDMRRVEGEWRWYGHVTNLNMTIEVLDFRAFIRRAQQRNRAFFTKLSLF